MRRPSHVTTDRQDATPSASPTSSASPAGRFYRPELDALRFVAFFSVFIYHFTFAVPDRGFWMESFRYSGAFGMCLFFVLSAYLITELLTREHAETGAIHIRAFYVRRILRIWPLYFFFIGLVAVIGKLCIQDWAVPTGTIVGFALLTGNWYLIYHAVSGPIMPLWSISLEEQFYLVWPSLAKLGRRVLLIVSLLLIPVSHAAIAFLVHRGSEYDLIWWNSFAQFQYFGIGAALALLLKGRAFQLKAPIRLLLFVGAVMVWLAGGYSNHLNELGRNPIASLLLSYDAAALGSVMLFFAFLGARSGSIPGWIMQLGRISYGLYVFHEFCIELVLWGWAQRSHPLLSDAAQLAIWFVFSMTFTIVAASLSYRLLERPFLRLKKRFEFIETRVSG